MDKARKDSDPSIATSHPSLAEPSRIYKGLSFFNWVYPPPAFLQLGIPARPRSLPPQK